MNNNHTLGQFDIWLTNGSSAAAQVMRQWLVPIEGKGAVIFPPTYPIDGEPTGYNIDRFNDGSSVCQIDSVGSQANRMEVIFKQAPYSKLVPQVTIKAGDKNVNLLDAGHRAADAIVRFSSLAKELKHAFQRFQDQGDANLLAKIAPTTLVFGAWDSRETYAKVPRTIRSVIRAFQVDVLLRSAQYIPPIDYVDAGLIEAPMDKKRQDAMSEQGFSHVPSTGKHGGVRVRENGEIRRDAALNLVAVRALGTASPDNNGAVSDDTLALRRYILGLALVAFTAPQDTSLREGCQLVPDIEHPAKWELVHHDGRREAFVMTHGVALEYAQAAAAAFTVGEDKEAVFSSDTARTELAKSKDERKAQRRQKSATEKDKA